MRGVGRTAHASFVPDAFEQAIQPASFIAAA
jgi:hypothetical protein